MSEQTRHDLGRQRGTDEGEESLEGCQSAFLPDPEQAGDPVIDLVDQRQVFVAFGVLDFIHADRPDRRQRLRCASPQPTTYSTAWHAMSHDV